MTTTPPQLPKQKACLTTGCFISVQITVLFFMIFIIGIVPKFQEIFDSFETELPIATIIVLTGSRLMMEYWFIVLPIWLLSLAGYWLLLPQLQRNQWGRKILFVFCILIQVVLGCVQKLALRK